SSSVFFILTIRPPSRSTLFPYTTLFRSEPREPFEEPLRRDARGVEEHVRMPAQEVEGRVAPEGTTAMGHEDREVGEILGYVIQGDRVSVLRSRAGEDRGPRVDCDGHAESLGGLVNRAQGGQLAIRI